ncbi:MAG: 3-beta hydroxysteroid dehydrogenase, partial [Microbacterium sp.]
MRIAIAGATGTVGGPTVEAVRAAGHEPIALSRSGGVDLITGAGLDAALEGVDAVIDTVNVTT